MNRREVLTGAAALGLSSALPLPSFAVTTTTTAAPPALPKDLVRLMLDLTPGRRHTLGPGGSIEAWTERCRTSALPGTDVARVWARFALWVLDDPAHGILRHNGFRAGPIIDIAGLHRARLSGEPVTAEQWSEARQAARDVRQSTACSAAQPDPCVMVYGHAQTEHRFMAGHDCDWNWSNERAERARQRYKAAARLKLFALLREGACPRDGHRTG